MDLEQLEAFALGPDRQRALEQLIPGTVDYYFHRCLLAQHRGDFASADETLAAWIKQHGTGPRVTELERRAVLLRLDRAHQPHLGDTKTRTPAASSSSSVARR